MPDKTKTINIVEPLHDALFSLCAASKPRPTIREMAQSCLVIGIRQMQLKIEKNSRKQHRAAECGPAGEVRP